MTKYCFSFSVSKLRPSLIFSIWPLRTKSLFYVMHPPASCGGSESMSVAGLKKKEESFIEKYSCVV